MSTKPKILIIGTVDQRGGAARIGWDIGETMRKRGYWVKYIVGYKQSNSPHVYELKRPWITNLLDKLTGKNITGYYKYLRSFFLANDIDFGATQEIFSHPWYKQADIIHFHNLHGSYFRLSNLLRMGKEKKLIWTLHDMWAISGNCVYTSDEKVWKQGHAAKTRLMEYPPMLWNNAKYLWNKKRQIYQTLKIKIVTPSKWLRDIVGDKSILSNQSVSLIHNGIEVDTFSPYNQFNVRNELKLPHDKRIVVFVAQGGIHEPRKGWQYIDQIIHNKEFKGAEFLCIGGGRSDTSDEPNVKHIPYITNKKTLAKYYAASDAFLFTSLAENCPLVVLESLSCGTPVVSFDVGGVKELVTHKINGYISKYLDIADLAHGLKYVLNLSSSDKSKMRKDNRNLIESKFSTNIMADGYQKLYESL